jgi:hypothetical protein
MAYFEMNMKYILLVICILLSIMAVGQEWQQVGNFNRPPTCLFTDTIDNLMYISGAFRFNGSDTLNGVCIMNGTTIQAMGAGIYGACGTIDCASPQMFIRYKNEIYTSSNFKEIAGQPSKGIARWNGSTWLPVTPGLFQDYNNGTGYALGSCEHDGLLYMAGSFRRVGQDTANSVASWDGNAWQTYSAPEDILHNIPLHSKVIFYKGEMYVGGNCYNIIDGHVNYGIIRYDGTAWHQVGSGLFGGISFINNMVIYHDELFVCGRFNVADGNAGNMIMRWDGEQWHDVGGLNGCPAEGTKMMVYQDKLYLVGLFDCVGDGMPVSSIAVWDGTRWCSFGNSYFNNEVTCIGVYNGEFYIGGYFTKVGGYPVKYFAKWIGDHITDTCSAPVSLALEPKQSRQLSISPNPVRDYLHIQWNTGKTLPDNLRVFDPTGKEMTGHIHLTLNENSANLQTGQLPPGVYFLQVLMEDGGVWNGRFLKE